MVGTQQHVREIGRGVALAARLLNSGAAGVAGRRGRRMSEAAGERRGETGDKQRRNDAADRPHQQAMGGVAKMGLVDMGARPWLAQASGEIAAEAAGEQLDCDEPGRREHGERRRRAAAQRPRRDRAEADACAQNQQSQRERGGGDGAGDHRAPRDRGRRWVALGDSGGSGDDGP